MIAEAAPDATAVTKWGMPFYSVGANTLCALAAFKAHVNLILPGPPGTYADPDGLLEGDGKTGKHLELRPADAFPRAAVRGWLRTPAARARGEGRRGRPQVAVSRYKKTVTRPITKTVEPTSRIRSRRASRTMCRLKGSPTTARTSSARS